MKLTRKLAAAMLSVCMVLALLTNASAAALEANYGAANYYEIAVTTYSRMLAFQNGGVVAAANQAKQYGLIDPTGKVVLPFQYAYVWALGGDKFAVAQKEDEYGRLTGLGVVNSAGKTVLAPSQDCMELTSKNGVICVATRTKDATPFSGYNYAYYTTDWKPSTQEAFQGDSGDGGYVDNTPPALKQYDYYEEVDGYYRVHSYGDDGGEQTGLLDSQFKVVVPLGEYGYVGTTNEDGYTSVTKLDGTTDLYKDGNVVKTYTDKRVTTEVYFRHLAFSADGEHWGMMDLSEKVLLSDKYYVINDDGNGCLLTVSFGGAWDYMHGLYTQDCQEIFPDKYSEITYLADGKYKLNYRQNHTSSFGVSKVDGTTVTPVIPMKYLDMRVYTLQFIELFDGSKYSVVDLNNNVVVPESTKAINAFNGNEGGLWETLDRVENCAEEYDNYTKSVLPFLSQTGSGWVTTYADYETGKVDGQLNVRASNIRDDGWFVYQNANGLMGFGRLNGTGFLDITPGHWAEKAIDWAVNHKPVITAGVGDGKFNADSKCTNAMILTFLWRAAGEPDSTAQAPIALKGDEWYAGALRWAAEKGMISQGFDPEAYCTSATAAKFIWQAFGSQAPKGPSSFTDVPAGSDYADAVAWAEENGITNGEGNHKFAPDNTCSRGRIVTFLYRAYVEEARLSH